MSDSLRPHESHHARPPCPSPTPRVHPNSCTVASTSCGLLGNFMVSGDFFPLPFLLFVSAQNMRCHHSSISSTMTIQAHYHNKHAPVLIIKEVTRFRSCLLSVETTPACQVSLEGVLENEDIKRCWDPMLMNKRCLLSASLGKVLCTGPIGS